MECSFLFCFLMFKKLLKTGIYDGPENLKNLNKWKNLSKSIAGAFLILNANIALAGT